MIQIQTPTGQTMQVAVPAGVRAGTQFQVSVPTGAPNEMDRGDVVVNPVAAGGAEAKVYEAKVYTPSKLWLCCGPCGVGCCMYCCLSETISGIPSKTHNGKEEPDCCSGFNWLWCCMVPCLRSPVGRVLDILADQLNVHYDRDHQDSQAYGLTKGCGMEAQYAAGHSCVLSSELEGSAFEGWPDHQGGRQYIDIHGKTRTYPTDATAFTAICPSHPFKYNEYLGDHPQTNPPDN